jgi:hypothetical protein
VSTWADLHRAAVVQDALRAVLAALGEHGPTQAEIARTLAGADLDARIRRQSLDLRAWEMTGPDATSPFTDAGPTLVEAARRILGRPPELERPLPAGSR